MEKKHPRPKNNQHANKVGVEAREKRRLLVLPIFKLSETLTRKRERERLSKKEVKSKHLHQ